MWFVVHYTTTSFVLLLGLSYALEYRYLRGTLVFREAKGALLMPGVKTGDK